VTNIADTKLFATSHISAARSGPGGCRVKYSRYHSIQATLDSRNCLSSPDTTSWAIAPPRSVENGRRIPGPNRCSKPVVVHHVGPHPAHESPCNKETLKIVWSPHLFFQVIVPCRRRSFLFPGFIAPFRPAEHNRTRSRSRPSGPPTPLEPAPPFNEIMADLSWTQLPLYGRDTL